MAGDRFVVLCKWVCGWTSIIKFLRATLGPCMCIVFCNDSETPNVSLYEQQWPIECDSLNANCTNQVIKHNVGYCTYTNCVKSLVSLLRHYEMWSREFVGWLVRLDSYARCDFSTSTTLIFVKLAQLFSMSQLSLLTFERSVSTSPPERKSSSRNSAAVVQDSLK